MQWWCNLKPLPAITFSVNKSVNSPGQKGSEQSSYLQISTVSVPMTYPWDERYIYLHGWLIFMVNVGKYNIRGSYGVCFSNVSLKYQHHWALKARNAFKWIFQLYRKWVHKNTQQNNVPDDSRPTSFLPSQKKKNTRANETNSLPPENRLRAPKGNASSNKIWLVVSTHLKNISQNGNLPQIGMKIKIFETTTQKLIFMAKLG